MHGLIPFLVERKRQSLQYQNTANFVLQYAPAYWIGPDLVVPCIAREFAKNLDSSSMTLARAPVSAVIVMHHLIRINS